MKTARLRISGRVQDVGFRAFARRLAAERDITGNIRNLSDGSVEIVAQGEKLESFLAAVKEGPRFSEIEKVQEETYEEEPFEAFEGRF